MHPTASPSAQPTDPWFARLAFLILQGDRGEWRRAVMILVVILAPLVVITVFAGSWAGALTAGAALTAGGTAVARRLGGRTPAAPPDPALDPPP